MFDRNYLLGIFARLLLVVIKPISLFVAIKLDPDKGLLLAEVFLFSTIMLAVMATNAHKEFYKRHFDKDKTTSTFLSAKYYLNYFTCISHQLLGLLIILSIFTSLFSDSGLIITLAILYTFGEKLSDEFLRYFQFSLDNLKILIWATLKLLALISSIVVFILFDLTIGLTYPIASLMIILVFSSKEVFFGFNIIVSKIKVNAFLFLTEVCRYIVRDIGQTSWVILSIIIMSADKWIVKTFSDAHLAQYMLAAQIASGFIILQTTLIMAPNRKKLITQNPFEIRILHHYSVLIALISWFFAALLFLVFPDTKSSYVYLPFLFSGVFVLTAPYLERMFWIVKDYMRVMLEFGIILLFFVSCIVLKSHVFMTYEVIWVLPTLLFLLSLRLILAVITTKFQSLNK